MCPAWHTTCDPAVVPSEHVQRVLRLEVPVIVRLAERPMDLSEVLRLVPGSIIELHKPADAELDFFVNDRQIGNGSAVKVNENFGIRLTFLGTPAERLTAATSAPIKEDNADALAEQLLSGQT